jgi:hypothetical protein
MLAQEGSQVVVRDPKDTVDSVRDEFSRVDPPANRPR